MTHADLVQRAERWLKTRGCVVILSEVRSLQNLEIPDAIGWGYNSALSYLVECKATRPDYLRDKKKIFRHPGHQFALGRYRYYMAPPKLIKPEEVPKRWGLLEVHPKTVRVKKKAEPHGTSHYSAFREMNVILAELGMMHRMLRGEKLIPSGRVRRMLTGMKTAIEVNGEGNELGDDHGQTHSDPRSVCDR